MLFSVIIPVYNGAEYVNDAVESVFGQTESSWELIIVNDGSADNTDAVLEKYKNNNRVKYIKQKNLGVSAARNRGIAEAKGEYIAFLDADDVWHKDHLEVMRGLIEKYPDAGLYGSFTRTRFVNGKTAETCRFFETHDATVYLEDFFEEYSKDKSAKMFTVITTCVSKKALEKAGGFPVGCRIGEDLEMSLRVAAYFPVVLTSRATATYNKENSQATKNDSFDPDWGFFEGVKELYKDDSIPYAKRENIKKVMQWFTMRRCRHYIINGEKDKARLHFAEIGSGRGLRRDKFITLLLLYMPSAAVRKLFELRWRGKA